MVVLAGRIRIADSLTQCVRRQVRVLWEEQAATFESEVALVIRPQACEGAKQRGFADAASAFEQYPFGRTGLEVNISKQGAASLGVDGEVLQDDLAAMMRQICLV